MNKEIKNRMAQRVSAIKTWLDAESKTGNIIMGEDGPITHREVLLINAITLFLIAGCMLADASLLASAICIAIMGLLVWRLNLIDNKRQENGKRGIYTNQ